MMKTLKAIILGMCIIPFIGCEKFKLLKDEDMEKVSAGANLKTITVWQYLNENNFHENDLTALSMYAKAVQRAGLVELLNSPGDYTIILPNNTAITAMLKGGGYASVDDVPPIILRNFLLANIFQSRIRSFDLAPELTYRYGALNGDSIYVKRSEPYALTINDVSKLSSSLAKVRTQNLEFNNAVVHVVPTFTYYALGKSSPDNPPSDIEVNLDKVLVTKDAYVKYGTRSHESFNTTTELFIKYTASNLQITNRSNLQFPLSAPTFSERIGNVKLFLYCHRIDGNATVDIYHDEDVDWDENTLTSNNAPETGTSTIGSFKVVKTGGINKWYSVDITSGYVNALTAAKQPFMNIGIWTPDPQVIGFLPREYQSGQYSPYLMISSAPVTILKAGTTGTVNVNYNTGIKTLTLADLSLQGTSDKNITYILTSAPNQGYIGVNGWPISTSGSFTQEQIATGMVKYFYSGSVSSASDSFTVEAKDHRGGYYSNLITVPVQIN